MTLPRHDPKIIQEVRKWTIRNDEWVQVTFALARGPKGLSDRPTKELSK